MLAKERRGGKKRGRERERKESGGKGEKKRTR